MSKICVLFQFLLLLVSTPLIAETIEISVSTGLGFSSQPNPGLCESEVFHYDQTATIELEVHPAGFSYGKWQYPSTVNYQGQTLEAVFRIEALRNIDRNYLALNFYVTSADGTLEFLNSKMVFNDENELQHPYNFYIANFTPEFCGDVGTFEVYPTSARKFAGVEPRRSTVALDAR